jgi:hypothetical protein
MKNVVVWIDDVPWSMRPYLEAVQRVITNCSFACYEGVDIGFAAINNLGKENKLLVGLILDMGMPTGSLFGGNPRAQGGSTTGLLFYEMIRREAPNVPVLFLSNNVGAELIRHLEAQPLTKCIQKSEIFPDVLTDVLKEFFHIF